MWFTLRVYRLLRITAKSENSESANVNNGRLKMIVFIRLIDAQMMQEMQG